MQQVERHIIKYSHKEFKKIDSLCWLSKNLYNAALYRVKQSKEGTGSWIRYNDLEKEFRIGLQLDYHALPGNTSQQILMVLDKNLKSFFALLNKWKYNPKSLKGCPQFPKYKHKIKGRNLLVFTINQAKFKPDKGIITFPKKTGIAPIKTKIKGNLHQVRIIPQSSCYVIEVVYEKEIQQLVESNNHFLSLDIGLNNLACAFDTQEQKSFIVNGRSLKAINHYYNKKKAKLQSDLKKKHNKHTSKKLKKLTFKRNNKIKDYLHKSSRFIVNYCLESGISNIAIGHNNEWKQEINLGKKTNQNFVSIPFNVLIEQIQYKAALIGIVVHITEESYTSKCSALDLEEIKHHENYLGKRIKRGMFRSATGKLVNADLNGAINIYRKVNTDKELENSLIQTLSNKGQVVWPFKTSFEQNK